MNDVIEILKLRLLIFRRALIETSWKDRIKAMAFFLLFLFLACKGIENLLSRLFTELDENTFAVVPWWTIIIFGIVILLEGLRSLKNLIYNNPENELLLSLPIQLKHIFLERWLERLILNILFMSFCGLVLFQYSQFAHLSWRYIIITINVLLLIQQLQFICTMTYSRKIADGLKNIIYFIISLGIITLGIIFLSLTAPQLLSNSSIYIFSLLTVLLLLITFILQSIFVSSFNREYNSLGGLQFKATRSFHKLFNLKFISSMNQNIKALVTKDMILLLRQFPVLQSVVSFFAILFLTFIMNAQAGENRLVIYSVFAVVIIFIWTMYLFEFEKKQLAQMWILKVHPLTSRQIWQSKVIFIVLLLGINFVFLLIPGLIGNFDLASIGLTIGWLIIQAVIFSSLAVSALFGTYPFLKAGEYMYVILFVVFYSIVIMFPPLLIIIIPIIYLNYKKGLSHLEYMEL